MKKIEERGGEGREDEENEGTRRRRNLTFLPPVGSSHPSCPALTRDLAYYN